ncbi:MAG TPA: hypothetical protein VKP67_20465 [Xanthobacteraceae bacterium]|nr:hypothetical protein [Xanthobacteraceae bacterium]
MPARASPNWSNIAAASHSPPRNQEIDMNRAIAGAAIIAPIDTASMAAQ